MYIHRTLDSVVSLSLFCYLMFGTFGSNITNAETVRGIEIDFVTIGNTHNPPDTQEMIDGTDGYGSVDYVYSIGKYEVTNAQWNIFTAAAGVPTGIPNTAYNENALYTGDAQPANRIGWYEAAQFTNYLTSGKRRFGVYEFDSSGNFEGVDRAGAEANYGTIYFLPTEDEWYKAAYYKPDGSGYSLYANGTNIPPIASEETFYDGTGEPWDVGSGIEEQNGTFDMMGNVFEWNETQIAHTYRRGLRGGAFVLPVNYLEASHRAKVNPEVEDNLYGFRVASNIPEPTTLTLLAIGGLVLRKRNKR